MVQEDGALARKRAAIRKRRQAAAASAEAVGSTEEPKVEVCRPKVRRRGDGVSQVPARVGVQVPGFKGSSWD